MEQSTNYLSSGDAKSSITKNCCHVKLEYEIQIV